MAKLYITEFNKTARVDMNTTDYPEEPGTDQTPVTFTTTTQSVAFAKGTKLVRIHTDSICSIAFGTDPTATTGSRRLIAGQTEYFAVPPGQSYKVAAVTNT